VNHDSILVLSTRENSWWLSMQEIIPAIERVWTRIGQPTARLLPRTAPVEDPVSVPQDRHQHRHRLPGPPNIGVFEVHPGATMTVLPKWTMCVVNAR